MTDLASNLIWQQMDNGENYSWDEACKYCEELTLAGRTDWELPNIYQLQMLLNQTVIESEKVLYWSTITKGDDVSVGVLVDFCADFDCATQSTLQTHARCVASNNDDCKATYDMITNTFHVPCYDTGSETYWLEWEITEFEPLKLGFKGVGKVDSESIVNPASVIAK